MATAAFKSTSRRLSIGDSNNSNSNSNSSSSSSHPHHRRSRSVSRFSHRVPVEEPPSASRKGKFVNTVRGSGVPEISLDDLAIEMFSSSDIGDGERGRTRNTTSSEVSSSTSHRRGRSVSRRHGFGDQNDGVSRRRRSLSVLPKHNFSVSQNGYIQKNRSHDNPELNVWSKQKPLKQPTCSNQQRGLRKSSSQKDFLRSYDGYSSYSSTLTDDEGNDLCYNSKRSAKEVQVAPGKTKGTQPSEHGRNSMWLRNEYTKTTKNIRQELGQVENQLPEFVSHNGLQSADSDVLKAVSTLRSNYKTKLEESEKRKQELLAEIMLEEERGKELKKIVVELLPNPKSTPVKRATRGRKRSTDRNKLSKQLEEDADKIIEEFISSVEETDISSFDGERSDTSSVIGGAIKPLLQFGDTESFKSPLRPDSFPGDMDGVVLPWLKWETGNDSTPLSGKTDEQHPTTPKTVLQDTREMIAGVDQEQSFISKSSRGSWSPGVDSFSSAARETSAGKSESCKNQLLPQVPRKSRVDIDRYLKLPSKEGNLSERWKQRESIKSGGLLICYSGSLGEFIF